MTDGADGAEARDADLEGLSMMDPRERRAVVQRGAPGIKPEGKRLSPTSLVLERRRRSGSESSDTMRFDDEEVDDAEHH